MLRSICELLARQFTVIAYDRDWEMSGDRPDYYSLDREAADFVEAATLVGDGERGGSRGQGQLVPRLR